MAWDPTQPPNNGSLLSAPIRGNFAALAPLMQGPGGTPFPLLAPDGTAAAPSYGFASNSALGLALIGGVLTFTGGGTQAVSLGYNSDLVGVALRSDGAIGWSSTGPSVGATDVRLARDGAGYLAQRNGANVQHFRLYGGASHYLELNAMSGYVQVLAQGGGGIDPSLLIGTSLDTAVIRFHQGGNYRWDITSQGFLAPGADNTYDIGGASLRPRSIYAGTSFVTPVVDYPTGAAPATPAAGHVVTYAKTDKKMYAKDDAGLETPLGGGGTAPSMVPLWLENARFPDGSANNLYPLPVERTSTGTVVGTVPKLVELVYQFRAANVEWLLWKLVAPLDYVSGGAVVLVTKWTMISATTGNIRVTGAFGHVIDGTTVATTLVTPAANVSADQSVPTTLGAQKETRLTLTSTGLVAGSKLVLALSLGAGGTSPATGDRVLESAHLEFARA